MGHRVLWFWFVCQRSFRLFCRLMVWLEWSSWSALTCYQPVCIVLLVHALVSLLHVYLICEVFVVFVQCERFLNPGVFFVCGCSCLGARTVSVESRASYVFQCFQLGEGGVLRVIDNVKPDRCCGAGMTCWTWVVWGETSLLLRRCVALHCIWLWIVASRFVWLQGRKPGWSCQ